MKNARFLKTMFLIWAEVAGIGDEDLVNDVIQRAHQQGDDAGNGISPHELTDTLRPQKLISGIHKIHLSFKIKKAQVRQIRTYAFLLHDLPIKFSVTFHFSLISAKNARSASATGFTQKRHTLYAYYNG